MRILITGGAGFIGSHLTQWALHQGHEASIIDDFNDFYNPQIKRQNFNELEGKAHLIEGDIRDKTAIKRAFTEKAVDAVIHIAARAGVRPSIQNPQLYVETNVLGTLNLLEACRENKIKKFVFASTSSIYGVNPKVPFSETDLVQSTLSPYASTKLCCEQLCSNYSQLYGIQINCLRFFTVYGPRQRPDLAIHKFASAMLRNQPIDQYGDGSTRRDYTYIDDIVQGVAGAMDYDSTPYEIINLGENETTTLKRLIELLEQELGVKAKINLMPDQPGDVPITFADIQKAKRLLNYNPRTKIESGIKKFVHWLKSQSIKF